MICEYEKCDKKVPLAESIIKCKCGKSFCKKHKYWIDHDCKFDYRAFERETLEKQLCINLDNRIVRI